MLFVGSLDSLGITTSLKNGCLRASSIVILFSLSTVIKRLIKSAQFSETKLGISYCPFLICSNIFPKFFSVHGIDPVAIAYKMTPHDQISLFLASYNWPLRHSGEAKQGDPHGVFVRPLELSSRCFDNPKSDIFMCSDRSISIFSSFKSR